MPDRTYADFDLLIEPSAAHGYRARILDSPAGETPAVPFVLPFSDLEVENFLLRIGQPRRRGVRGVSSPELSQIREFGGKLFDAVFHDDLRVALATSVDRVEGDDRGLRLRLRLNDCPELSDLPWEFLYDRRARRFLALSQWTPVIRYLELPARIQPLQVSTALRVLVFAASPADLDRLDIENEWENLNTALGTLKQTGRVELDRVSGGSLRELRRQLRRREYHVLHYVGHGGYDRQAQDGILAFEGPEGRAQPVTGADFGGLLHDHRSLRLAVLNSCEGARGGLTDPYAGVAQSLVLQGIPAVVAMQFEITDEAAITFSHAFYEAIVDGLPIDAAIAEARNAIREQPNPVEWATPVLYLRASDGHIFDLSNGGTPATETPAKDPRTVAGHSPQVQPPESTSPPTTTKEALREGEAVSNESQVLSSDSLGNSKDTASATRVPPPNSSTEHPPPLPPTADHVELPSGRRMLDVGLQIKKILISPDGRLMALLHDIRDMSVWDLITAERLWGCDAESSGYIGDICFSPDGKHLALLSEGWTGIRDSLTGTVRNNIDWGCWSVQNAAAAFSPDGLVFAASGRNSVRIFSTSTWQPQIDIPAANIQSVALHPDGARIVTLGSSCQLWDISSVRSIWALTSVSTPEQTLSMSPDGTLIAMGPGNARLHNVNDGERIREFKQQGIWFPSVNLVQFSPDGRHLATDGARKTARIWDVPTGNEIAQFAHPKKVTALAFTPDGITLVTGSGDGVIRFWDSPVIT